MTLHLATSPKRSAACAMKVLRCRGRKTMLMDPPAPFRAILCEQIPLGLRNIQRAQITDNRVSPTLLWPMPWSGCFELTKQHLLRNPGRVHTGNMTRACSRHSTHPGQSVPGGCRPAGSSRVEPGQIILQKNNQKACSKRRKTERRIYYRKSEILENKANYQSPQT